MKYDSNEKGAGPAAYSFQSEPCLVREFDIASLIDSDDNHFHRMEGEKWEEFVGSIRQYGVISPLIVRSKGAGSGQYEILAGHNRRRGAQEAGLATVPCIPVDVDDVDASVLIGVTNRQREEVSDLEWGWTYRTTLEALKHQGVRGESGQRSIDIVARKYGVGRKTAQRKIRLTYLVPQLYDLGRRRNYTQKMLVDLSYLPAVTQINVVQAVIIEDLVLTESAAAQLRARSAKEDLSIDQVLSICRCLSAGKKTDGEIPRPQKYEIPDTLFPKGLPKARRNGYLRSALAYLLDHGIDPEDQPGHGADSENQPGHGVVAEDQPGAR